MNLGQHAPIFWHHHDCDAGVVREIDFGNRLTLPGVGPGGALLVPDARAVAILATPVEKMDSRVVM
jgi:hypothetical protein